MKDILDELVPAQVEPQMQSSSKCWSPLQEAIFDALRATSDNLLIRATAGSGKTTTLMEMARTGEGSSVYLAFNADIVKETKFKYPFCNASTFHSLGNQMWRANRPQARLEKNKVSMLLLQTLGRDSRIFKEYGHIIPRIIGLAKNNAWSLGNFQESALDFEDLIERGQFEIDAADIAEVAMISSVAFYRSISDLSNFDFDDMIYMPVRMGWQFPYFSLVFVDECQDLNPLQHIMLQRMSQRGSRIIAVGDRYQAIYAFRGALSNSMDLLKDKFSMLELPLSVTYRCPKEVVKEAQLICPEIFPREDAPEGKLIWKGYEEGEEMEDPQLFTSYQLVLCRNNSPLFSAILRHVRAKSPCRVKTNFLDGLTSFIRHFKEETTIGFLLKLDLWFEKERSAAESKGYKSKVASLTDKYETLKLLAQELDFTWQIVDLIKQLQDSTVGPTFSTIHKAKGLEAPHVYLLRPDLIPAFYAKTEEAKAQEMNLKFVAITRSQETFTYGVEA